MARNRSLTAATVALAIVVALTLFSFMPCTERASASPLPRCEETQLDVTLTSAGVATGHVGYLIVISNVSSSACAISGYPTVTMSGVANVVASVARKTLNGFLGGLGEAGAKLSLPTVTLHAHGGTASSLLEGSDNPVGKAVGCVTYKKVSIALPRLSPPYRYSKTFPGCTRAQVHPIVKGARGTVQ
jgi:hypothetical protein